MHVRACGRSMSLRCLFLISYSLRTVTSDECVYVCTIFVDAVRECVCVFPSRSHSQPVKLRLAVTNKAAFIFQPAPMYEQEGPCVAEVQADGQTNTGKSQY